MVSALGKQPTDLAFAFRIYLRLLKATWYFWGPKLHTVITTLLQWIRTAKVANKHLHNGQEIDPEDWVHPNVRNM